MINNREIRERLNNKLIQNAKVENSFLYFLEFIKLPPIQVYTIFRNSNPI